jgi:hypothetical protein
MRQDPMSHTDFQKPDGRGLLWNRADEQVLARLYPIMDTRAIAAEMGRNYGAVRARAKLLRLAKPDRHVWTEAELRTLAKIYPDTSTAVVAQQLAISVDAVNCKAHALGLRKTEAYLASPAACRLRRGDNVGAATRYSKGHVPANKGLRRPGYCVGNMASTQFKPGQRGSNWLPIGSTRINADGYLDRKISDTGYPRDWRGEHILLWEEHLGPVPPKHCVCFKNHNKTDIRIDNLQLLSRRERMRRNTIHNLPKELVDVMRLRGRLNRQINKRVRHEEQDAGPAGSPVRNARGAAGQGSAHAPRSRASRLGRRANHHQQRQS